MSERSLLVGTLAVAACSVLSTLPRSGRIAWKARSRPCLAEPPAESPSTMKSSHSEGSVELQSASLPGRLSRCETAPLRCTSAARARSASRAAAAEEQRKDAVSHRLTLPGKLDRQSTRLNSSHLGTSYAVF